MPSLPTARPVQDAIANRLEAAFAPLHLEVINESHLHNVPPGSERHFKVVIVGEAFDGQPLVRRHRAVNTALAAEFEAGLHALSIVALTPAQWADRAGDIAASPNCMGGSKHNA